MFYAYNRFILRYSYYIQDLLPNFEIQSILMKYSLFIFMLSFIFMACEPPGVDTNSSTKKKEGSAISDAIRMPVSANEPLDTTLVAKMDFEETVYDFGSILEGRPVTHTFKFTNTGVVPLVISDAKATCGCTVPSYPEDPIPPGQGGEIKVVFNTAGKTLEQSKPVSIIANTFPSRTLLTVKGYVHINQNK